MACKNRIYFGIIYSVNFLVNLAAVVSVAPKGVHVNMGSRFCYVVF